MALPGLNVAVYPSLARPGSVKWVSSTGLLRGRWRTGGRAPWLFLSSLGGQMTRQNFNYLVAQTTPGIASTTTSRSCRTEWPIDGDFVGEVRRPLPLE